MAKKTKKTPAKQAQVLNIDKDMFNDDIVSELKEFDIKIDTVPTVIDIVDTKNEDFVALYLMAEVKLESNGKSKLTKAQQKLKGFTGFKTMLRSIEVIDADTATGYSIGDKLEGFAFQIQDADEEFYEGQNPRCTKDGDDLLNKKGKNVYRQAVIIDDEELEELGHDILKVFTEKELKKKDKKSKSKKSKSKKASKKSII